MTLISLQALTWTTVAGAVVGALLLASSPSAEADRAKPRPAARSSGSTHGPVTVQRPVHHEAGAVRQVTHQTGDVAAR
jgi:hypothetical protein